MKETSKNKKIVLGMTALLAVATPVVVLEGSQVASAMEKMMQPYELTESIESVNGSSVVAPGDTLQIKVDFSTHESDVSNARFFDYVQDPNLNSDTLVSGQLTKDGQVVDSSMYKTYYDSEVGAYALDLDFTLVPGGDYEYTYQINVVDEFSPSTASDRKIHTAVSGTSEYDFHKATAEIILDDIQQDGYSIIQSVSNVNGESVAKPGDTLQYKIDFSTLSEGVDKEQIFAFINDPNLDNDSIVVGQLTKDGEVVDASTYQTYYSTAADGYVLNLGFTLEPGAEYEYTYQINVVDEISPSTASDGKIHSSASGTAKYDFGEVFSTISIVDSEVEEDYSISQTVNNLTGTNIAKAGDTLEYKIDFKTLESGVDTERIFAFVDDINLDASTLVPGTLTKDGGIVPASEYELYYDSAVGGYAIDLGFELEPGAQYEYTYQVNVVNDIQPAADGKIHSSASGTARYGFEHVYSEIDVAQAEYSLEQTVHNTNGEEKVRAGDTLLYKLNFSTNEEGVTPIFYDKVDDVNLYSDVVIRGELYKDGVAADPMSYIEYYDVDAQAYALEIKSPLEPGAEYTYTYKVKAADNITPVSDHLIHSTVTSLDNVFPAASSTIELNTPQN